MKISPNSLVPACLALALIIVLATRSESQTGQVPDPQLNQLIAEVAAQQAVIVANHGRISAKIAEVEENVRQARIFASRSGRGTGGNN